ncbi:MAG TPA: ribbon-helix-helix protein, CopG family [Caldimonas sp.]
MQSTKAEPRTLTTHVPRELAEQVDALAEQLERSRGWVVKRALSLFVGREIEKDRLTREGLAAIDAGRVVAHADVKAWAASLGTKKPLRRPRAK